MPVPVSFFQSPGKLLPELYYQTLSIKEAVSVCRSMRNSGCFVTFPLRTCGSADACCHKFRWG